MSNPTDDPRKKRKINHSTWSGTVEVIDLVDELSDDDSLWNDPTDAGGNTMSPSWKGKGKGKGKAKEEIEIEDDDEELDGNGGSPIKSEPTVSKPPVEDLPRLSDYPCPICFSPPAAATLIPCGHVFCGSCLFSSVEVATSRARNLGLGGDALVPKCPFCRATIDGWDGRGGGVIGLTPKVATRV